MSRWSDAMLPTYAEPVLTLVRGDGATVWDDDGNAYTDLVAGIAVNALGPRAPGGGPGGVGPGRDPRAHLEPGRQPAVAAAGRAAARPDRPRRAGVLRQLRRRGERGSVQDRPAHRPHVGGRGRGRLPRPHHGRARPDRSEGEAGAVRAAAGGRDLRAVRRRAGAALRGRRVDRGRRARADARRGRRRPGAGRLPGGGASGHPAARCPARPRRGADRHRPYRRLVRAPDRGRRAGRPDPGQGARRRPAGQRLPGVRRRRVAAGARPARHHLRRQPGGLRRRPRRPRHHRAGRPARAGRVAGQVARDRDHRPRPPAGRDRPRHRPDARHRADRPGRRRGRGGSPAARVPGQRGGAGRHPAGAAAGPHRHAGRRVRQRAAPRSSTPLRSRRPAPTERTPCDPALPARRRPQPGRADRGARPGRPDEGRPVRPPAAGRAAGGGRGVRQAVDPHPGVVLGRHRRARRLPAGDRRAVQPARPRRAGRGHHPGARPAVRGDRLADLRPGPDRRDGLGQPGAGGERADRRVPPLPDPGRPADRPRAQEGARRTDADLPR